VGCLEIVFWMCVSAYIGPFISFCEYAKLLVSFRVVCMSLLFCTYTKSLIRFYIEYYIISYLSPIFPIKAFQVPNTISYNSECKKE